MDITKEKERLKIAIDKVEDPEILDKISAIISDSEPSMMTGEQLSVVRERREQYLKNPSDCVSLEEFKAIVKQKYGF
ncbi:hypothetical protein HYN59_17775 [Flavobacterium album]|uniref:Addiction module protein n=1 Tax=Flavobacterium album TaxID=2175091 RepID=A0A2S1R2K6_9FLAO|nr:hypothetical protein [Flavobacterium album]AWH86842.1 hypothetical protein HYN59_17775 [Flavobacterium album]